jgi:hypothetical protein
MATYVRSPTFLAATLPLPLYRLTSLRVCAGAAPLLFDLGVIFVLRATIFDFAVANNKTLHWSPAIPEMQPAAL